MTPRALGRSPPDAVMLAKAPQLSGHMLARAPPPAVIDRSRFSFTPELDDNDRISNCTAVTLANCARAAAVLAGYTISIPTAKVTQFYSRSTGYDPTNPATDLGGIEAQVLAHQARNGFSTGGQTDLVGAWGTFDPKDQDLVRNCVAAVGTCYIGVNLSTSDRNMQVWDTNAPATAGDPTPGSWGGHATFVWSYTGTGPTDMATLGTWGGWQRATWRWLLQRMDEAHAVTWRQLNSAPVNGLHYDRLVADGELFANWLVA